MMRRSQYIKIYMVYVQQGECVSSMLYAVRNLETIWTSMCLNTHKNGRDSLVSSDI